MELAGTFVRHYGLIAREASTNEIQKVLDQDESRSGFPVPELIRHGQYFVTGLGQIIGVSRPCALDRETAEILNHFCRNTGWGYEVLPYPESQDEETPLHIVFRTGFFVSPD